jgi:hypothetical protein
MTGEVSNIKHDHLFEKWGEIGTHSAQSNKRKRQGAEKDHSNVAKQLKLDTDPKTQVVTMSVSTYCKQTVDNALTALILGKSLPFELTESFEFREFVRTLSKGNYTTPCAYTLTRTMIPTHYKEVRIKYSLFTILKLIY